jgi:hypothetical protein
MSISKNASRAEELAEIAQFVAERGVTHCPPAFVEPVPFALPLLAEQARIAALATRVLRREDRVTMIKRMLARASRRHFKHKANWWSGAAA